MPQTVGGNLYLRSVTSLDGVTMPQTVGGNLYLESVTSVPAEVASRFGKKIKRI
jgi:hypothetical protein